MNGATKLALGTLLMWLAGLAFFVAFHPNGVVMPDGKPAKNPADILKYMIFEARGGAQNNGDNSGQDQGGTVSA